MGLSPIGNLKGVPFGIPFPILHFQLHRGQDWRQVSSHGGGNPAPDDDEDEYMARFLVRGGRWRGQTESLIRAGASPLAKEPEKWGSLIDVGAHLGVLLAIRIS